MFYRLLTMNKVFYNYTDLLIKCLQKYCEFEHTNIIVGDFNCLKMCWNYLRSSPDYIHSAFMDFVVKDGLTHGIWLIFMGWNSHSQILTGIHSYV